MTPDPWPRAPLFGFPSLRTLAMLPNLNFPRLGNGTPQLLQPSPLVVPSSNGAAVPLAPYPAMAGPHAWTRGGGTFECPMIEGFLSSCSTLKSYLNHLSFSFSLLSLLSKRLKL